jgi:hypothetical protein
MSLNPPMKTNKQRFWLALALTPMFGLSVFGQNKNPSETVISFYKFHLARSGIFSLHEVKIRKRWLTAELYRLLLYEIKREDEFTRKNPSDKPFFGDGFPFEPLEECVDGEKVIRNLYEIKEVSADANKAIVEVKFFIPKECEDDVEKRLLDVYQIELLKVRNIWLINDWIYADKGKLSETLKREKY